jgi:hypothetical protein
MGEGPGHVNKLLLRCTIFLSQSQYHPVSGDFKSFVRKKYPTKHASPGPQERPGVKKLVSSGGNLVFRYPGCRATAPLATGRSALTQNREMGLSGHFQDFNLSARIV